MKCPKCQFDNPDGAKFCSECGNKLELACPECGKANPLGSKFCNECGHNLKEAKEAPCIDYNQPQSYAPKFLADKILTKFVGRIKETKRLKGLCELAKSGSGQVVELEGEAGVGKSRLLYEFKNALPQDEYTYLEGRCYHYGGTTPYLPIL
ncbi:MAG: zinc-ribbon domain-containing protein, partial [Candidatus Hodarchaeota archaeon]